jgi:hypothetical protein
MLDTLLNNMIPITFLTIVLVWLYFGLKRDYIRTQLLLGMDTSEFTEFATEVLKRKKK